MDNLELDVIRNNHTSCSLDKSCQIERIGHLKNTLFSKSTYVREEQNRIKAEFPYSNEILKQIVNFITLENVCCNDFIINMQIEMKKQVIQLEII